MQKFLNTNSLFSITPWQQHEVNIFLLLDCADEAGIVNKAIAQWTCLDSISLYIGTKDEEDADIGPHLFKITNDSLLMKWFLEEGADYGIILFSECDTALVAAHLRPYLECVWPDGRQKMFRFYSPTSLCYFIPSLTPEELGLFMGPICGIACTRPICAEEGDSLFVNRPDGLKKYEPPKKNLPWFLSDKSMEALEIPSEYALANILTNSFSKTYHAIYRRAGKENIRRLAKEVVIQNRDMRFSHRANIETYMAQVAILGIGWRHDPLFRRITQAVECERHSSTKLLALIEGANEFKKLVYGTGSLLYYEALRRIMNSPYSHWKIPNSNAELITMLALFYPERAEYCGMTVMEEIVNNARIKAQEFNLPTRPGIAICSTLQFMLGINCYDDPLYPWLRVAIETSTDQCKRAFALFETPQLLIRRELNLYRKLFYFQTNAFSNN